MRRKIPSLLLIIFAVLSSRAEDGDAPAIGMRPMPPAEMTRVAAQLRDPDPAKAVKAARDLGESRQPSAAAALIGFYGAGDGERRMAAVQALGQLNDVRPPTRGKTSEWTAKTRSDTMLSIALGDILFSIRRQAALALAQADGVEAALKRFVDAANDAKTYSPLFRNRAVHHAAAVGGARACAFLREKLASLEMEIAFAAAEELGELKTLENLDALLGALSSDRADIKSAALSALERLTGNDFKYDLIQWTQWRAGLRDGAGKEAFVVESSQAAKLPENPPEKWPVDIVVAFDTTGSFLHVWPDVNRALSAVLREMARIEPSVRVGLIRYRAIDQRVTLKYTLQPTALTPNIDAIQKELSIASFGGGSGALHEAIRYALGGMVWRERSRKAIVVIGDDTPVSDLEDAMKVALQFSHDAGAIDGIQIDTLYAKTIAGEENRPTYRRIAMAGIGRFYEFNKKEMHLVEMSAENVDAKAVELPAETARKWLTPRSK